MIEARGSRPALVRAYSFFSLLYGRTAARLEREAVTRGLRRAAVRPGERVLEVAVGTGVVHARLRARLGASGSLVGVDLAPGMLAAARRQIPQARLVRAQAGALPFPADRFDLVWSSYLLDLIPTGEIAGLVSEFRRVLKPGGRLLLVNFSKNGRIGEIRRLSDSSAGRRRAVMSSMLTAGRAGEILVDPARGG